MLYLSNKWITKFKENYTKSTNNWQGEYFKSLNFNIQLKIRKTDKIRQRLCI